MNEIPEEESKVIDADAGEVLADQIIEGYYGGRVASDKQGQYAGVFMRK